MGKWAEWDLEGTLVGAPTTIGNSVGIRAKELFKVTVGLDHR